MQKYIGTKIVLMKPMTRLEYNTYRGWTLPDDEDGTDDGYLVEYQDGGKANMFGHTGYVSWSPKEQADYAYRQINSMTFGLAVEALKQGKAIRRDGWNDKGMFVYRVPGNAYVATTNAAKTYFGEGALVPYNAYYALKGVDGRVSTWVPSINDVEAEDWSIYDIQ